MGQLTGIPPIEPIGGITLLKDIPISIVDTTGSFPLQSIAADGKYQTLCLCVSKGLL